MATRPSVDRFLRSRRLGRCLAWLGLIHHVSEQERNKEWSDDAMNRLERRKLSAYFFMAAGIAFMVASTLAAQIVFTGPGIALFVIGVGQLVRARKSK